MLLMNLSRCFQHFFKAVSRFLRCFCAQFTKISIIFIRIIRIFVLFRTTSTILQRSEQLRCGFNLKNNHYHLIKNNMNRLRVTLDNRPLRNLNKSHPRECRKRLYLRILLLVKYPWKLNAYLFANLKKKLMNFVSNFIFCFKFDV